MVTITELELKREPDEERAAELAVLIAEALLDLGERQRATGFLVRAVTRFPASALLQDALGTVGHDDDWHGEVERLTEIGEQERAPEVQARVFLRAARILRMAAPDDPRYETLLRRVLKCDPFNDSAGRLLGALYSSAARWDDLEAIELQLLAAFPGDDERAFLCQRYAFDWCSRGDDARAVGYAQRAVELGGFVFPIAAVTLLRGIYAPRRQWAELLTAVDAVLETPMDEDPMVHAALLAGTIAWRALHDLDRARGYFDRVRRVATDSILLIDFDNARFDRDHPETLSEEQRALVDAARRLGRAEPVDRAVEAWRKAIAADPERRGPRRGFARLLHQVERWRALVEALRDEEQHACPTDALRVALLLQLVAIYRDRLRQEILAIQCLNRVLELEPGNLAALDQLEALHEATGRFAEVVAILKRKLDHVADPVEKRDLHLRLAQLYSERLGNEPEALRELDAAIAIDPALDEVAARLESAYTRRRDWDRLIALKRRRLPLAASPEARIAQLSELALLVSEKLKRPAEAIAAFQELLAAAPDHDEALAALEKLYAAERDHARLAEICARRAELTTDPAQQAQHLQKLAGLYADELHDPARAIDAFQKLLALDPKSARAQERLKKLYLAEHRWGDLEALFSGLGRLDDCVRLFERQAEGGEEATRAELWLRVGLLYRDRLGKSALAVRAFERVLACAPHEARAIAALIPHYEQSGEPRKLAEVYAAELATTAPDARKARLVRLAELHERALADPFTAFRWQLQAFEHDPGDPEVRAPLERLARATAAWPLLIEAYQRAAGELSPEARLPLLTVVAGCEEEVLGDAEAAIATWRAVLAIDSAHPAALDALESLYGARRRYDDLQGIYARKLELTSERPVQLDLWCKMAALAEEKGDDVRALAAYRGVLEVAGDELRALSALDRILERRGEWRELEPVLRRERALLASWDPARQLLTFRLAGLSESHLGDEPGAIALYRELVEETPSHAGARAALERHLGDPGRELEVALILEPVYRALGDAARLVEVRQIRIDFSESSEEKTALLHTIARAYEEELAQPEQAFAALGRALKVAPDGSQTFAELERLAARLRSFGPLSELYREVAARPLSIDQHVEIRCRLARVYQDELGDPERALATFTRVLDLRPGDPRALRGLARLGEGARAEESWRALLESEPDDPEALAALAALYEGSERWSELVPVLERQVSAAQGGPLAEVLSEQLALVRRRAQANPPRASDPEAPPDEEIDASVPESQRLSKRV